MAERIGDDGIRVRFTFERLGELPQAGPEALVACVEQLVASGLCPTLDDGLLAGNASALAEHEGVWVTPSGRRPGVPLRPDELVLVTHFDPTSWSARGYAPDGTSPTSDTPLHWAVLKEAWPELAPADRPRVALHGHALDDEASTSALGIPISAKETLFSTPEDRAQLAEILHLSPYPAHQVWSRRGHGFFLVADEYSRAIDALSELMRRVQKISHPL